MVFRARNVYLAPRQASNRSSAGCDAGGRKEKGLVAVPLIDKTADILFPGMQHLGFGCGDLSGGAAHVKSARLVETALDVGIRYFDVARLYGNGSAEAVLGSVLPRVRDRVIIASKAGILPWSMLLGTRVAVKLAKAARYAGPLARALVPPPPPAAPRFGAFRLSDLGRSVDCSLKALRTDYLDILLLHECSVADAHQAEVLGFVGRLRAAGKIRSFGIATNYPATVEILKEAPAPVAQFASDAFNRNVTHIPADRIALVVTHTPIKQALPRLIAHLIADPAARARWEKLTGIASNDRSGIASLLLADAVAENGDGMVLFSSSRPERIAEAVKTSVVDISLLVALREEVARMRCAKDS
jgi:D-threo-aldose 1-dehydrogenase